MLMSTILQKICCSQLKNYFDVNNITMQNIAIQSTDFKNRFSDLKQINFPSWMDAANVSGFV